MIYKITLYQTSKKDTVKVEGLWVKKNHAVFIETKQDLEKKYEGNVIIAIKPQVDDLPEYDLFGEKIVIHKG